MIKFLIKFFKKIIKNSYVENIKDNKSQVSKYISRKVKFHDQMDPLWKNKLISRNRLYKLMSNEWGCEFHVANLNNNNDFKRAYECLCRVNNIIKREQFIKNVYSNTIVSKAINRRIKRKCKKFK